jgi:hypothetical protein
MYMYVVWSLYNFSDVIQVCLIKKYGLLILLRVGSYEVVRIEPLKSFAEEENNATIVHMALP